MSKVEKIITEKTFKKLAWRKIVENLISVKVWTIFVLMFLSSSMVYAGLMTGAVWASVNGGVISTVFAMREAFKVSKIRRISKDEAEDINI